MRPTTGARASQPQLADPTLPPLSQKGKQQPAHSRNFLQPGTAACGDPTGNAPILSRGADERSGPVNAKHPRGSSVKGWIRRQASFMRRLSKNSYCGGSQQRQGIADGTLLQIAALGAEGDNTSEGKESEAAMLVVTAVRHKRWTFMCPREVGMQRTRLSATDAQGSDGCVTNPLEAPRAKASQPQEQQHNPTDGTTAAWPVPGVGAATAAPPHVRDTYRDCFVHTLPSQHKSPLGRLFSFQRLSIRRVAASAIDAAVTASSATGVKVVGSGGERHTLCCTPRLSPRREEKYKRCKPTPLSVELLQSQR
ncbi:hypothetical protein STCU_11919 [Strigomonas culicis]|uniref:Uncharacterized protein n=1 Tax=Strigomonas culicis TaxID=28005 RepID=S9ULM8_9TRYP|nr:hypothetical protein STCU_11919 [Strigomonas culicis]|eukprot:EPY15576.1 hypothetical protein STCU_11919 [Strigomonas culicis]